MNPSVAVATPQAPAARLHDIGELTVINQDHGRVHHHVAMVRLVPATDLNSEAVEYLNDGR